MQRRFLFLCMMLGIMMASIGPGCFERKIYTEMVLMRDGQTHLATKVFLPKSGEAPWPVILLRTPYDKEADGVTDLANTLNQQGFAVVAQDIRGRYASEGEFEFFHDDGWGENQDGYDTLIWLEAQDWNNGKVCIYGGSALGITQYLLAGSTPPGFTCLGAVVGTGDLYHHTAFQDGVLFQSLIEGWLEAIGESDVLPTLIDHVTYDEFWHPIDLTRRFESVTVPGVHIGGWYDIFAQGTVDSFKGIQEQGGDGAKGMQKLVMGPWTHAIGQQTQGELTYPANSTNWTDGDYYGDWYRHYLLDLDNGVEDAAPVTYYVMGDVDDPNAPGNEWRTANAWPIPAVQIRLYLHSGGTLSTAASSEPSASTTFTFDPLNPVPTVGGNNLFPPAGPMDQRSIENRSDVLIFTTPAFSQPLEITGPLSAKLWVSSSAVDTDFTVKLTDVYPDGRSMLIIDSILRMRYREGSDQEVFMTPGEVYQITVDLWSTSIILASGHKLRVAISSSNSPRFDVNPNTGDPLRQNETTIPAAQTLYHDANHPSHLVLPIVLGN